MKRGPGTGAKNFKDGERCIAITVKGKRCQMKRYEDASMCYFHQQRAEAERIGEMSVEMGNGVELSARNVARLQAYIEDPDLRMESVDMVIDWLFRYASQSSPKIKFMDDQFMKRWRSNAAM